MRQFWSKVWAGWKRIAHVIGVFQTKIILTILYFIVVGVASMVVRLTRRDLLDRGLGDAGSLWKDRAPTPVDIESARRQF